MFPATVGFLSLVAIVFFFGVLSARKSSRNRERRAATHPSDSSVNRTQGNGRTDVNEADRAMAMAGATGVNNFNPDTRPQAITQR